MFNEKFFKSWETLFDGVDELFDEAFGNKPEKKEDEKKDKNQNYYHYVSNKYENGKCVEHEEKIVDNGKVIKNEGFAIEGKKKEVPRTIGSEVIQAKNKEIESLKEEVNKLNEENQALKEKIAQVRKMFN